MKKYFIALISLVFALNMQAQKIKLVDGDLKFLKGQDEIGVQFTYDENMKVGAGTEAEYIDKKMAQMKKNPDRGKNGKKPGMAIVLIIINLSLSIFLKTY